MKLTPKKGQCTICQKFYILYWAQKRPMYNLSKVLHFVLGPKKADVQFVKSFTICTGPKKGLCTICSFGKVHVQVLHRF
jgi:hypothetical protein